MHERPYITVIVPVYNNEVYLRECIDSLIIQSLSNIEILLIDDGSTDNSGIICDEYEKKDSRVRVIHKSNEGLGLTRNCGMNEAEGEYFTFLDSDDYVASDMYEKLWVQAKRYDADACICGISRVFGSNIKPEEMHLEKEYYNKSEIQREIVYQIIGSAPDDVKESKIGYSMCTGIYRLEVVKKNKLKFYSEREYKVEDVLFKIEYYSYIERFTYISDACYMYRCNESSLTHKYKMDVFEAMVRSYKKEFELLMRYGYSDGKLYASRMFLAEVRNCMRMIMKSEGFGKSLGKYKEILECPEIRDVIDGYPYHKNPIQKRVFNYLLDKKMCFLIAVIIKINILFRESR